MIYFVNREKWCLVKLIHKDKELKAYEVLLKRGWIEFRLLDSLSGWIKINVNGFFDCLLTLSFEVKSLWIIEMRI